MYTYINYYSEIELYFFIKFVNKIFCFTNYQCKKVQKQKTYEIKLKTLGYKQVLEDKI